MGKYASGLTVSDICKLELDEVQNILSANRVNEEDAEKILDSIKEAYFQLSKAYTSNRALERLMQKKKVAYTLHEYMDCFAKEEEKFPFVSDDGEDATCSPDYGTEAEEEEDSEGEYDDLDLVHAYEEDEYDVDDNEPCNARDLIAEILDSAEDIKRYADVLMERYTN